MSDEAMESVPGLKPIQYTAKHYSLYLDKIIERTDALNKGGEIKICSINFDSWSSMYNYLNPSHWTYHCLPLVDSTEWCWKEAEILFVTTDHGQKSHRAAVNINIHCCWCCFFSCLLYSSVDPQSDWTPHRLEMCLWAMTVATQQQLPLVEEVGVKGCGESTDGSNTGTDQRPTKKLKTRWKFD